MDGGLSGQLMEDDTKYEEIARKFLNVVCLFYL